MLGGGGPAGSALAAYGVGMHDVGVKTVALKEWGAAIHALLEGRQRILLRKGGIGEKSFIPPEAGEGFVLFPTVAHTHADRTRTEHHDLLAAGARDATDDAVVVRAAVHVAGVVEVRRPDRLPLIEGLHIWTAESIRRDRVEFRPVKPLQMLVVQALALSDPVRLNRLETYGGCRSWIDVDMTWDGGGRPVVAEDELAADLDRVRTTVG